MNRTYRASAYEKNLLEQLNEDQSSQGDSCYFVI